MAGNTVGMNEATCLLFDRSVYRAVQRAWKEGAERRMVNVETTVKMVNAQRHKRSTTIAAKRQSLILSCFASSLSTFPVNSRSSSRMLESSVFDRDLSSCSSSPPAAIVWMLVEDVGEQCVWPRSFVLLQLAAGRYRLDAAPLRRVVFELDARCVSTLRRSDATSSTERRRAPARKPVVPAAAAVAVRSDLVRQVVAAGAYRVSRSDVVVAHRLATD